MDKVTWREWRGNNFMVLVLSILGITIPLAVVYILTNMVKAESQVPDAAEFLSYARSKSNR